MTADYWGQFGGCPICEVGPGLQCRDVIYEGPDGLLVGDVRATAHPARPPVAVPANIAALLDEPMMLPIQEGVVVKPGDTLVIRIDPMVVFPDEVGRMNGEIEQIRSYMEARLPRGCRCIVIAMDGQLGVARVQQETQHASPDATTTAQRQRDPQIPGELPGTTAPGTETASGEGAP